MAQETDQRAEISKLENYCKRHQAFYSLAAQKTIDLGALASSLKSLSVRWVENKDAWNVDQEKAELKELIEAVTKISGALYKKCFWLNKLADLSTNSSSFSNKNAELNNLTLDWIILQNVEQQAAENFLAVARSLKKAVTILSSDALFVMAPDDIESRFNRRLLLVAAAMVNESASKARATIDLNQREQNDWQNLEQKIKLENNS